MTFAEITQRRIALAARDLTVVKVEEVDPLAPEWQLVSMRKRVQGTDAVVYQRCGGGRRILRKRIGGG